VKGFPYVERDKNLKCWKVRNEQRKMVVGYIVEIEAIMDLLGRKKVGRFCGKIISPSALKSWIDENWTTLLGYRLIFHTLSHGWICFISNKKVDLIEVFSQV
jgi:hypothetical protein